MLVGRHLLLLLLVSGMVEWWSNPAFAGQSGDRDCGDFANQEEAQEYFIARGGSPSNNADLLDVDGDGIACETLSTGSEVDSGVSVRFVVVGFAGLTVLAGMLYWSTQRRSATRFRLRTVDAAIGSIERRARRFRFRKMDAAIESIELKLRQLIDHALEGDADLLPPQIAIKNAEKIQHARKQNANLDSQHYATLAGKLEYLDLRELQAVITNKSLWPRFESRFGKKESFDTKFGQLAELRNAIRHSRPINEICRKEGEAAILWFNHTLGK